MKKTITCRPCKEQNNWEIENQYGVDLDKHYNTKSECVKAGQKMAAECGAELTVNDNTETNSNY